MAKALALLGEFSTQQINVREKFQEGLTHTVSALFAKDNGYTLFRSEDLPAWVIFTSIFLVLIIFDNVILHRNPSALTVSRAVVYTLFWIADAKKHNVCISSVS